MLCLINESNSSVKISFHACSSYTFTQRRVFASNSSAYCEGFMPGSCANLSTADSVSTIISFVVYFFRRKFTTCGYVYWNLDLTVVFRVEFLLLKSAHNYAFSTAEADLFLKKWKSHMAAPSRIP